MIRAQPFPNPDPRSVRVLLDANAAALRLRLYSASYSAVLQWTDAAPHPLGWSETAWPAELKALPGGSYFLQVSAQGGDGSWSKPALARLYRTR